MKKFVLAMGLGLTLLAPFLNAQQAFLATNFTVAGNNGGIRLIGSAVAFNGSTWTKIGTVTVCSFKMDSSTDGVTWGDGNVLGATDCSTNGASAYTNSVVNYVRVRVTSFTGTGTVNIVQLGYILNPAASGDGITSINTDTTAAQIITSNTSGTNVAVATTSGTTTISIPTASGTNTGKLAAADWTTFNGKQAALGYTPAKIQTCTNKFLSAVDASATSGNCVTVTSAYVDSTITKTIASGAKALATGAISSAACTSAQTDTATGTLTTDAVIVSFNGDPTAVTGYVPLTAGMLTIIPYPTADTVNFKVCNNTSSSITPGAITLNWRVVR